MKNTVIENWIEEKKAKAKVAYEREPFPDRVSHLWKYSDPKNFELNGKEISNEKVKLVFNINNDDLKKKGVILQDSSLAVNNQDFIKFFGLLAKDYPSRITYLNDATWSSGYFLYVPHNVKIEKPMVIKSVLDESNKLSAIRILIILEEGAKATLIDEITTSSESKDLFTNVVVEMFLAKNATLNYLNIQTLGKDTTHHLFQRTKLEEHAELTNLIVALGGKVSKADLGAKLSGYEAQVTTYGIVLGDSSQKFDHHTRLEHAAPHTKSTLNFRVVLKDKARSAYTGNLKITHEAVKSDAIQENRNLLLSAEAKADSIPELEILTNDVIRCNHGVTVSPVDKEQIYYLTSRGLSDEEAEKLITEGFLEPTISRIPDEALKEEILMHIKTKLGG